MSPALGVHTYNPNCAHFTWPTVTVPENFDHSRVVTRTVEGFDMNVLLPGGYDAPGNTKRYPVLYVLHGGGWDPHRGIELYLALTDIIAMTANDDVIVVFPYGGIGDYSDWRDGIQHWESYLTKTVISYVDGSFRTIADRAHRAIAGESMGGGGAMRYAAHHPDLFVAAASFSGVVDTWYTPFHLGFYPLLVGYNVVCFGGSADGPWGPAATNAIAWHDNNPVDLAGNLDGVSTFLGAATGIACHPVREATRYKSGFATFDLFTRPMAERLASALTDAGLRPTTDFKTCGLHDFPEVNGYLHAFWPQMTAAFGTPPPSSFDFRRAAPTFSVWGWNFTADATRATEFLTIRDASCGGIRLTGSGMTSVTTAPCFVAAQRVSLTGAVEGSVAADGLGRITFHVDLGPAHRSQEYTAQQRVLITRGGYWRTRAVTFR